MAGVSSCCKIFGLVLLTNVASDPVFNSIFEIKPSLHDPNNKGHICATKIITTAKVIIVWIVL